MSLSTATSSDPARTYLGSLSASEWTRFERNIRLRSATAGQVEADWESVASNSWSKTDGLVFRPRSSFGYDLWVDDIRLSNAMTVEHNVLRPGSIRLRLATPGQVGHIVRSRSINPGTYAVTDRLVPPKLSVGTGAMEDVSNSEGGWLHYDQVGSVMAETDAGGDDVAVYHQDAFGNLMTSWSTGAWDGSYSGWPFDKLRIMRHHNTKEYDDDVDLV